MKFVSYPLWSEFGFIGYVTICISDNGIAAMLDVFSVVTDGERIYLTEDIHRRNIFDKMESHGDIIRTMLAEGIPNYISSPLVYFWNAGEPLDLEDMNPNPYPDRT